MSSPDEPGTGNGLPWERGPGGQSSRAETTSQATGVGDRINRFISGAPAAPSASPSGPSLAEPEPPEARTEVIRSELPDLSGMAPRPARAVQVTERKDSPSVPRPQVRDRPSIPTNGPVRASMQLRRVDPWSVLKVSLVLSVALFFVWMIAVAFLYLVLGAMGVWSKLNSNVGDLLTNTTNTELVSSGTIFGGATIIGLVNIVLITAMATVGAFIYNATTDLVGGVEVTLADRD